MSVFEAFYRTFPYLLSHPLGRRHRVAVIGRWIRWQISSRLLPFPIAIPYIGGTYLVQERGLAGSTGNIYVGLHEFYDMALVLHFLRTEDLFFDIGANVGSYTLLAGAGANARCYSFEPVPSTFARLKRNVGFNLLDGKVKCYCVALGDYEGTIRFTNDCDTMNHVVDATYSGDAIDVPVRRLDTFEEEVSVSFDAMIWKVDVEGFEERVLGGATARLADARLKVVLLEADSPSIRGTMQSHGFRRSVYDPFQRRLEDQPESGKPVYNNLWVRDVDFVRARLESAPKFTISGESI